MPRKIFIWFVFLLFIQPLYSVAKDDIPVELQVVASINPLLQYQDEGENKGPTIGILNAILAEAQLEANVAFMPWARAFSIAESNPNTIILSMIRTPEREDNFYWIIKVSRPARVFISLESNIENHVETIEQAKEKLIAVILNSAEHKELIAAGFSEKKNLYIVSSREQMVKLLANGRVDLLYTDPNNARVQLEAINKPNLAIHYKKITMKNQRTSYIALNKGTDKAIAKRLQQAADKFVKTPEYAYLLAN
ncbi:transporter substrate-binding domain-containing protein [Colwellia sp. 6_MG-2023]|uniref:substrate-binding periplasmic protein n=1 Tax=Colwellia sp. 6_MG-2023 TaxID=3062676 RepID=UPI0026E45024|nr:transporter substrate-binding domain-containing protein [Colwellia sp. 6_MG-2023]MDO6486120.1 transporter substrate-binding domain-containing protein [Colwellia sp. 6_MG-2023]